MSAPFRASSRSCGARESACWILEFIRSSLPLYGQIRLTRHYRDTIGSGSLPVRTLILCFLFAYLQKKYYLCRDLDIIGKKDMEKNISQTLYLSLLRAAIWGSEPVLPDVPSPAASTFQEALSYGQTSPLPMRGNEPYRVAFWRRLSPLLTLFVPMNPMLQEVQDEAYPRN